MIDRKGHDDILKTLDHKNRYQCFRAVSAGDVEHAMSLFSDYREAV